VIINVVVNVTMWDSTEVEVWPSVSHEHMLQIYGSLFGLMRSFTCLISMLLVNLEQNRNYGHHCQFDCSY